MEETVLKYIRELSPESRARVAAHFSKEVDEFAFLAAKITETLQRYHARNPKHDKSNPKEVAFALMTKGANTLMAGYELVLAGYMWEPPILFRSALEGFAVAWDLVHNESRFSTWKARKKFDPTDSISNLKKTIEPVGKMYGFLSNMHVHTGRKVWTGLEVYGKKKLLSDELRSDTEAAMLGGTGAGLMG